MQSVPITTKVVSLNPIHGEVYSIHYVIKVCQWLVTGRWFYPGTLVPSTNKIDRHDITEILLKVTFNTINQTKPSYWVEVNLCRFLIICLYTCRYCHWRFSYYLGRVGISLTGLTLPYCCACPKPEPVLSMSYIVVFFCVPWVKVRDDCSFYWYC